MPSSPIKTTSLAAAGSLSHPGGATTNLPVPPNPCDHLGVLSLGQYVCPPFYAGSRGPKLPYWMEQPNQFWRELEEGLGIGRYRWIWMLHHIYDTSFRSGNPTRRLPVFRSPLHHRPPLSWMMPAGSGSGSGSNGGRRAGSTALISKNDVHDGPDRGEGRGGEGRGSTPSDEPCSRLAYSPPFRGKAAVYISYIPTYI